MTTPQVEECAKPVVKLLQKTCRRLAESEANVNMFKQMARNTIATNDVRSYVANQSKMRRRSNGLDKKLIKNSMKGKLNDACAEVARLKQYRGKLRVKLMEAYKHNKSVARAIYKKCEKEARRVRKEQTDKNKKKYEHNARKQQNLEAEDEVPEGVNKLIKGVNVFVSEVLPENPVGPMVCC